MKKINERNQQKKAQKKWKCFRALLLHWFFTNDSTIAKTSLSHMMENWSPNLNALPRYVGHLPQGQVLNTIIQVKYP
jgi:hypothetical protein